MSGTVRAVGRGVARATNVKTAAVWAAAALFTAVAVSSVSAALERDDLIAQGTVRQQRTLELAHRLDELEDSSARAAVQREDLLDEIRALREQLIAAGLTPPPRPSSEPGASGSSSAPAPTVSGGSVRPPKPSSSSTPSDGTRTPRSPSSTPATPSSRPNPSPPTPTPSPSGSCRGVELPVLGCVGG